MLVNLLRPMSRSSLLTTRCIGDEFEQTLFQEVIQVFLRIAQE